MLLEIIRNPIFLSVGSAVILAQLLKTMFDYRRNGKFKWQSLLRGAGMPSSHTATVIALTLSVYLVEGINSLFLITFFFASIVIRDVIGDKVFATHQEKIINGIIDQISKHEKVVWTHLTGHTLTEVFAGMIVGILSTFSVFYIVSLQL